MSQAFAAARASATVGITWVAIGVLLRTRSSQCSHSFGAGQCTFSGEALLQFDIPVGFSSAHPNQFVQHSGGGSRPVSPGPYPVLRPTPFSWIKGSLNCPPERMWHETRQGH